MSCYELVKFLSMNRSQAVKVEGTKEWDPGLRHKGSAGAGYAARRAAESAGKQSLEASPRRGSRARLSEDIFKQPHL